MYRSTCIRRPPPSLPKKYSSYMTRVLSFVSPCSKQCRQYNVYHHSVTFSQFFLLIGNYYFVSDRPVNEVIWKVWRPGTRTCTTLIIGTFWSIWTSWERPSGLNYRRASRSSRPRRRLAGRRATWWPAAARRTRHITTCTRPANIP